MDILFIDSKDSNIYRKRRIINIIAILENENTIEIMTISNKIMKQLEGKDPDIIYIFIGGMDYHTIVKFFEGKKAIIVSDEEALKLVVDIYISDEAEEVLPLLLKAIEQKNDLSEVPGIIYRHTTKKANEWDINKIPFTAKNKEYTTFLSRGCKGQCSFCTIPKAQGKLRFRSIANVIDEVRYISTLEGFNQGYMYADCSFDSNPPKRLKTLLKALIQQVPYTVFGANFRPDFYKAADKELIELLFYAGNYSAFIGVETANEKDIVLYNKKSTVAEAERTIQLFISNDTAVRIGFINFNPLSTLEGIRENITFLRKHHFGTYQNLTKRLEIKDAPIKGKLEEAGVTTFGHKYYYNDNQVMILEETIKLAEKELNKNALAIYKDFNIDEIKRLKRVALLTSKEEEFKIIQSYEEQAIKILYEESDRLTEWLLKLIDMIADGTPQEEYFKLSRAYINNEHIREVITNNKKLDRELHREVLNIA